MKFSAGLMFAMFGLIQTALAEPRQLGWSQIGGVMATKQDIIRKLDLKPLPGEGGYFRETYRTPGTVDACEHLLSPATGRRNVNTAIYYMVADDSFSALHRLRSDEIFHYYGGDPVEMIQIHPDGALNRIVIGPNILEGQQVQVVVPAGVWQGTRLLHRDGNWSLLGTTMAPGFDPTDFELATRQELTTKFPQHAEHIERFTRE